MSERNIADLERRIQLLEQRIAVLEKDSPQVEPVGTQSTKSIDIVEAYNLYTQKDQAPAQTEVAWKEEKRVPIVTPTKAKSGFDLESKIGKQVMGIIASVLVFIGLCFLAVMVYPYMSQQMKFAAMYILSIGVLVGGSIACRRRKNAFSISLMSCGIGMIFISFLLTRLYFHYINDYLLYGLFFLWALGTILISKKMDSIIFTLIGYAGLVVSVVCGLIMASTRTEILFLNIYQLICILAYSMQKTEHIATKFSLVAVSATLSLWQLLSFTSAWDDLGMETVTIQLYYVLSTLLLAIPLFVLFVYHLCNENKHPFRKGILMCLYFANGLFFLCAGSFLGNYIEENWTPCLGIVSSFLICLVLLILLEQKEKARWARIMGICSLAVLYLGFTFYNEEYFTSVIAAVGLLPFALTTLFIGWKKKEIVYRYAGVIMILLNGFFAPLWWGGYISFILGLLGLLSVFVVIIKWEMLNKAVWKLVSYGILLIFIFNFVSEQEMNYSFSTAIFVISTIHLAVLLSGFTCKWENLQDCFIRKGEEDRHALIFLQVLGETLLAVCLLVINYLDSEIIHWLLAFLAATLCAVNMYVFLKRQAKHFPDFVWGIRFTIVIFAIVFSFLNWGEHSLIGTIIGLVLAVAFILWGFRIKRKSLRLYGLCLTMTCVLKLLLIDISYDNSIMRVIGFILGGIFCFAISWAYNKVTQRLAEKE